MATVDRPTFPSEGKAPDPDIKTEKLSNKTRKKRRIAVLKEKKTSKHSSQPTTSNPKSSKVNSVDNAGKKDVKQGSEALKSRLADKKIYNNKREEDARIEAAEAMSALASGCFSHNSNISSHGPNSDGGSDNDSVLVIDCLNEEIIPPPQKLHPKLSWHVQEDVVSSSSIHKLASQSHKSPNILSILGNRATPVVNDTQKVQAGQTSVTPQMKLVVGNVNDGMFIDQNSTVINPNKQTPTLIPRGIRDNMLPVPLVAAKNSVPLTPFQCNVPEMKDYCPPTKRSRTVETQTAAHTTETKIPDFNKLTLDSNEAHTPKHSKDADVKKLIKRKTHLPSSVFAFGKKNLSSCTSGDDMKAVDLRKQPNGIGQAMSSHSYVSQWLDSCSNPSTHTDQETNEKSSDLVPEVSNAFNSVSMSMETDEGLQLAQQNALKRLKDNLAKASPKERAFMLGQIQAIITMQKRQPIGIWSMNSVINRQLNQSSPTQNTVTAEKPQAVSAPGKPHLQRNGQTGQEISKVVDIRTGQAFPVQLNRFGGQNSENGLKTLPIPSCVTQLTAESKSGAQNSVPQQRTENGLKTLSIPSCVTQLTAESHMKIPTVHVTSSGRSSIFSKIPENNSYTSSVTNIPALAKNLLTVSATNRSQSLSPTPVKLSDSGSHLPFKKRRMLVNNAGDVVSPGDSQDSVVELTSSSYSMPTIVPKKQITAPPITVASGADFLNKVPDLHDVEIALKRDEDGDIPLHIAVAQENILAVRKYISLMRLVNSSVDTFNKDRQTPMHLAVVMNQVSIVDILLQAQSNVNHPNSIGQSALHLAAKGGHYDCMNLLLSKSRHEVQLDKKDFEGYSPLHLSVQRGDVHVTRLLIDHTADTNVQDGKSGRTPLFHAAEKNLLPIVDMLLRADAKVNVMNYAGITAVMAASGRGYREVVTLLMQYGADTRGTSIGDLTSKGPPVRNTTSFAIRQTMYSPNPGSDDSNMSAKQKTKKHSAKS